MFAAGILVFIIYVKRERTQQDLPPETPTTAQSSAPSASSPPASPAVAEPITSGHSATKPTKHATTSQAEGPKVLVRSVDEEIVTRIGSLEPGSKYAFALELSNQGAAVRGAELSGYFATVNDKRRYDKDPRTYETARSENPKKYQGRYSVLNGVAGKEGREYLPMATGTLVIQIEGDPDRITTRLDRLYWWRRADTSTENSQSAVFEVEIHSGPSAATARPVLKLVKTYTVTEGDYSIAMSLRMENLSDRRLSVTLDQAGPTGLPQEDLRQDLRQAGYAQLDPVDQRVQIRLKSFKELTSAAKNRRLGTPIHVGSSNDKNPVLWVGHTNKFFGSMMYLHPAVNERLEAVAYRAKFYVTPTAVSDGSLTYRTSLQIPELLLTPGAGKDLAFDIFVGPKKRSMFTEKNAENFKPLYEKLSYI
jgi:hypothetical protein